MLTQNSLTQFPELHDFKVLKFLVDEKLVEKKEGKCLVDTSVRRNVQQFVQSLSVLSPKRIRAARDAQESYGTESKAVVNIDALAATEAQGATNKP